MKAIFEKGCKLQLQGDTFTITKVIPKLKNDAIGLSEVCYDGDLSSGNNVRFGHKRLIKSLKDNDFNRGLKTEIFGGGLHKLTIKYLKQ